LITLALKDPKQFLRQVLSRMHRLYMAHVVHDPFHMEVTRWFRDRGDKTLRLEYDLNSDSVVFDVGGYVGDFAADLNSRYGCTVYVFEPSREFFKKCMDRFRGNPKVRCFNFGISDVNAEFMLSDDADGSSISAERGGRRRRSRQDQEVQGCL
jgi:hypothetical protein